MNNIKCKKYRMAVVFDLPVSIRDEDMIRTNISHVGGQFEAPRLAQAAVQAINSHDAMQDRIEELEQERDQIKTSRDAALSREREANREWSKAAKTWAKERDGLKAKNADIQAKAIEEVAGIFHDGEYRNHRVIDILIKEANRIRKPLVTKLRQQSTISGEDNE